VQRPGDTVRMRILRSWGEWACAHPGRTLLMALALTLAAGVGVPRLELELTFHSILPEDSPKVQELERIEESFPAAMAVVVVLETEARKGGSEAVLGRAVDALEEELRGPAYADSVLRVSGKTDLGFLKRHAFLLSEKEELLETMWLLSDVGLTSLLDRLAGGFGSADSEAQELTIQERMLMVGRLEGLDGLLSGVEEATAGEAVAEAEIRSAVDRLFFGSPYFLNSDRTMALLFFQTPFTMNDMEVYTDAIPRLDRRIGEIAKSFGVEAGLSGFLVVGKDEMVTSQQGLAVSMLVAVVLILALLILTFRMYSVPVICGVPLLAGVFWALGLAGFLLKRLNIISAMYMVALIGLGIDYAIHLLTSYVQDRDNGASVIRAVAESMRKSGAGVLTGALTTAIAFFALIVAESEVVKELGIIAGLGILCELAAMFLFVPAILGYRGRCLAKKGRPEPQLLRNAALRYGFMRSLGERVRKAPLAFLLAALALGLALGSQAGRVGVEGNIMNMEAKGLESIELQDRLVEEFGMAPDVMSVSADGLDEMRELERALKDLPAVGGVESLAPYYPTEEQQRIRGALGRRLAAYVAAAEPPAAVDEAELADALARLTRSLRELRGRVAGSEALLARIDDLLERLDGIRSTPRPASALPGFQTELASVLRSTTAAMAEADSIDLGDIPAYIRDSYISSDGELYLINIVPAENPWEVKNRSILTRQLETVTDRTTGMVLAADQMIQIAERDGVKAALAALLAIFVLLVLDFRNLKLAIATLLPLLLSFASLFGIMGLTGIKFDFVNIIAIPLLIGIGIDDAVHINHRTLLEGSAHMNDVIALTGKAVLLTSLTTIIAFGSFIPSVMRAMRSTGIVLSIAMALTFLFSIVFHPSVLLVMTQRWNWKITPWSFRIMRS